MAGHRRLVAGVLSLAYLGLIAALTLRPARVTVHPSGPLWAMFAVLGGLPGTGWITFDRFEFTANIAMFTPLGLLLTWWLGARRWWYVLLLGLAISVVIETAQLAIPGRVSDPRDVASNTIGAGVGILLFLLISRLRQR